MSIHEAKLAQRTALLAATLALLAPLGASAECQLLASSLKAKMDDYRSFRARNSVQLTSFLTMETECKLLGAQMAEKVAGFSAGLSCQSQLDVSDMELNASQLGKKCASAFRQLHTFQVSLHLAFEEVQDNLEGGLKFMRATEQLQRHCADELKVAGKLVEAFLQLEAGIVSVQAKSNTGSDDYLKLSATAEGLHATLKASGRNCGGAEGFDTRAIASTKGNGGGGKIPTVAGKHLRRASDLTGTERASREKARAAALLTAKK